MAEFDDLFDRPIPKDVAQAFMLDLTKLAVSLNWVHRMTTQAVKKAPAERLAQVASRNRSPALVDTALSKVTKKRALVGRKSREELLNRGSVGGASFQKAASLAAKLAVAAEQLKQRASDPPAEKVVLQEQQGLLQQALAESQALRSELEQTQAMAQEHAAAAEQAGAMAEQAHEELAVTQQEAQEGQLQAEQALAESQDATTVAQTEAQIHAQDAAAQSEGKMRLAIRIQQMRQQLADMASQDPVTEEGEQAEPILTATQQGMGTPAEQALEQDLVAQDAEAEPAPAASPKKKKSKPESTESEKAAAPQNLAKAKGFERVKEVLSGARLGPLGRAAEHARSRARTAAMGGYEGLGEQGTAERLFGRARDLDKERRREQVKQLGSFGGLLTLGETGNHILRRHNIDDLQKMRRSHPKAKEKTADAARRLRISKALAKQVGPAIHGSVTSKSPTSASTALARAGATPDRIYDAGHHPMGAAKFRRNDAAVEEAAYRRRRIAPLNKKIERTNNTERFASDLTSVFGTVLGSSAAGIGAGEAIYRRGKAKERQKTKRAAENGQDLPWKHLRGRSDARQAAGRAGTIPGAVAGNLASRALGHTGGRARAAMTLGGAMLGTSQGKRVFERDESARDLHTVRALTKERASRLHRDAEKAASFELTDEAIDALYDLRA